MNTLKEYLSIKGPLDLTLMSRYEENVIEWRTRNIKTEYDFIRALIFTFWCDIYPTRGEEYYLVALDKNVEPFLDGWIWEYVDRYKGMIMSALTLAPGDISHTIYLLNWHYGSKFFKNNELVDWMEILSDEQDLVNGISEYRFGRGSEHGSLHYNSESLVYKETEVIY